MAEAGTPPANYGLQDLTRSICSRFEGLSLPSHCCIFTVPERLRRTNEEAYTPRIVAIGPYHCLNQSLMPMEVHKRLYLQNFLHNNQNRRLVDYIWLVKSLEDEARNCYDKQINLNSDQFTEMMLLDGIFVIQLFLMDGGYPWELRQEELPNDQIFGRPWKLKDVRRDMILLENQIPFFVVERLFEMAYSTYEFYRQGLLLELMHKFFSLFTKMEEMPQRMVRLEVKHFVDAIRHLFLPLESRAPSGRHEHIKFSPSATELVAAGVKLTKAIVSGGSECLSDIKFENGELKIPCLVLYDRTESFFRNMIAFEQCYYRGDRNLISYMAFMDHLVDSPADTKLLMDKGIIDNWLSNKEAATDLINAFCKETSISTDEYYFYSLSAELIKHCNKPHNKWKATFKRDYCSSPWVVISVIAAGALLLLTVAQTVFSTLSLA